MRESALFKVNYRPWISQLKVISHYLPIMFYEWNTDIHDILQYLDFFLGIISLGESFIFQLVGMAVHFSLGKAFIFRCRHAPPLAETFAEVHISSLISQKGKKRHKTWVIDTSGIHMYIQKHIYNLLKVYIWNSALGHS